ncbi:hypothetical protein [Streptomyces sp. NPDC088925]|uniref:hypothetical protein n=1 Tax=Streptomyces sp. NPDC088925 TaxID=3365914 RepID=UPI00380601DB
MSAELTRLAERVADLERRLSATTRTARLAYSSIEDGAIEVYDNDGTLRGSIGVQPDGTVGMVAVNAPPPPAPAPALVDSALAGLDVSWDGQWANDEDTTPLDLALVQVHMTALADEELSEETMVAALVPGGGRTGVATGTYEPMWIILVAVNTSGVAGPPSAPVQGQARRAASDDILNGAITDLQLAEAAVTEAALAAAAVGKTAIQDGAISTPHMVANSIQGDRIAVGTLDGDRITARSITGSQVIAQSLTANELAANSVTALQLAAGIVDATHIKAGSLTAGLLAADAINGKVITGSRLQTAATGRRVVVDPERAEVSIYSGIAEEMQPGGLHADVLDLGASKQAGVSLSAPSLGKGTAYLAMQSPNTTGGAGSIRLEPSDRITEPGYTYLLARQGNSTTQELIESYASAPSGGKITVQQQTSAGFTWRTGTTSATLRDGVLSVPNIAVGTARVTPVADKPTSFRVAKRLEGKEVRAFVTASTTVPGTVVEVAATDADNTGFTLWVTRTNATATNVWWLMIGSDA